MKDCPRCHGSGEIGWNDSPINDPQCAQEATCNVCHGEGVVVAHDPIGDRDEAVMAEHFEKLEAENYRLRKLCGPDPERIGDLLIRAEQGEARVRDLEAERQHILDCINLYGDQTLHGALDAAGLLMNGREGEK
jgi:hypothetical protein